jgi:pseudaminic acid cytidylyltransferase
MKNRAIAIITARGGSKRIPRKNIKDFLGQPIIKYSIDTALTAGLFDEVMVSTDDAEIAEVAKKYGATVPFLRSDETANDHATTAEVLTEVLQKYRDGGQEFQYACCIYPTAPFVTPVVLRQAFSILVDKNADSVIPVTRFSFPIWRSFKLVDGRLEYNWPENEKKRSQDLPPAFHDCGQFYFFRTEKFLETKSLVSKDSYSLELAESQVQDIDTEEDWKIAELKYQLLHFSKFQNQKNEKI